MTAPPRHCPHGIDLVLHLCTDCAVGDHQKRIAVLEEKNLQLETQLVALRAEHDALVAMVTEADEVEPSDPLREGFQRFADETRARRQNA